MVAVTPVLMRNENPLYSQIVRMFGEPNGNTTFNSFADVWRTEHFRLEITGSTANLFCSPIEDGSDEEIHPVSSVSTLPSNFIHEWNAEHGLSSVGEPLNNPEISNDPTAQFVGLLHPNG